MATYDLSPTKNKENLIFNEVKRHSDLGFQETERRATGRQRVGSISFDEADELFRSWIDETNWPYDALLFDPRIFTFIFEKTSRLISNKPKAVLTPREGSDVVAAKINNVLLDYQWDEATQGGSMISKWAMMDMNARKYGAAFAQVKWKYETADGECVFDGPEFQVLNNRDIAHDLTATSIENCNWFQVRQYVTLQDLENINDSTSNKTMFKNLDQLRAAIGREEDEGGGGDTREVNWRSRNRQISRLETDPVGKDLVFKTVEIITEYRKDRWITIAPKHGIILRDIPNPYKNHQIPIVMLRYYAIDDDLYGLSEIEPVKGLQKAINALLCQYVDEINQNLYSPIAIGPGVRQHTLEWGKGARWIMNNPLTDFKLVESRSNAAQFFNSTYSVLVAAMMNTLGESSLGISNVQPMQNDKTATEVKALQLQRNARDQFNQTFLEEALKRQMMLWHSMNQRLLFSDPKKTHKLVRIVGKDLIDFFFKNKLGSMTTLGDEELEAMTKYYTEEGGDITEDNYHRRAMEGMMEDVKEVPLYPVNYGTDKKEDIQPKLRKEADGEGFLLAIEPGDLDGMYDFKIDVQSMAASHEDEQKSARQSAVSLLATNPNVLALLMQEGVKPKFKELFVTWLEDLGFQDADKYFEKQSQEEAMQQAGANADPQAMMKAMMGGAGGSPMSGAAGAANPMQALVGAMGGATPQQGAQTDEGAALGGALPNQVDLGSPNPKTYQQLYQP